MSLQKSVLGVDRNAFGCERERPLGLLFIFLLYVFSSQLQINSRIEILEAIRFEFILGIFLTAASILYLLKDSHEASNRQTSFAKKTAILYILYLSLFVPLSFDPGLSWSVYYERVIQFSLYGLFITVFIRSPYSLMMFLLAYILASSRLGFEGFVGWITSSMMWENQGIMRLHGTISTLEHPNSFSGFAVGLLPFIYFLYRPSTLYFRILLSVTFLFAVIIIVYTGSRTGYVATILFIAYILRNSKNRIKYLLGAIVISVIAIPFIPDQYVARFETIFTQEDMEGDSIGKRAEIISDSFEVFKKHPMGVGVGAFPVAREHYFNRAQDTHNLYLEILTNSGFIGLTIFLIWVVAIYRLNITTVKEVSRLKSEWSGRIGRELLFVEAAAKSANGFLVVRLILGLFGMDMYERYWWVILGLSIALSNYIAQCNSKDTGLMSSGQRNGKNGVSPKVSSGPRG